MIEGNAGAIFKDVVLNDFSGEIEGDVPLSSRFVQNLKLNQFEVSAAVGEKVPLVRKESRSWEAHF